MQSAASIHMPSGVMAGSRGGHLLPLNFSLLGNCYCQKIFGKLPVLREFKSKIKLQVLIILSLGNWQPSILKLQLALPQLCLRFWGLFVNIVCCINLLKSKQFTILDL